MIIFEYNIKLNTSSCFGKVCRNPRVEITLFSVLTLLQIQDSFPWESHCLKTTKNFISPESSRLNLETVMSCWIERLFWLSPGGEYLLISLASIFSLTGRFGQPMPCHLRSPKPRVASLCSHHFTSWPLVVVSALPPFLQLVFGASVKGAEKVRI